MSRGRTQVTLGFELDSEPISGSLRHCDGRIATFDGWIQLVSLLQAAATTRAASVDPVSNGTPRMRKAR
jgi:hypothetical protein